MMTEYSAKHSSTDIDVEELSFKIQRGAMQILGSFLNGGFSMKGFLLFPLYSDVNSNIFCQIRDILDNCRVLYQQEGWFKRSVVFANRYKLNPLTEITVAKFLEVVYKDLRDWVAICGLNLRKEEIKLLRFDDNDYSVKFLSPVIGLKIYAKRELSGSLHSLLIHGSLSTLDYVKGWSDFDTFMVLKDSCFENYLNLIELRRKIYKSRKYLYQIDPLQHHGHFIVTEIDLQCYPNSFLPTVVLKNAKPLFGPSKIKLRKRDDNTEVLRNLENTYKAIKAYANVKRPNIYQRKQFYHYVLLFPCLFLQSIGKPTYKRESFEIAKSYFESRLWEVIEEITKIRANWDPSYFEKFYVKTSWNPTLGRLISNKIPNLLIKGSKKHKQLVKMAEKLFDEGLKIIKNNMFRSGYNDA